MMNNIDMYLDSYKNFLYEEAYEDKMLLLSIKEICSTSLNESFDIEVIQEGKLDTIKNFFIRVIKAIGEAVKRFAEKITQLIGADEKFLANNKDIILSKVVKSGATLNNWYSYNILLLKSSKMPEFNEQDAIANKDKYKSKDDYAIGIATKMNMSLDDNKEKSLQDKFRAVFRGAKTETKKSEELNSEKGKMYTYLTAEFKDIKTSIDNDVKNLKNFNTKIETLFKSAAGSMASIASQQSPSISKESTISYYFNEAEGDTPSMDTSKAEDNKDKNEDNVHGNDGNQSTEQKNEEKKDDVADIAKYHLQVTSDLLSVKMNIAMEIYRIYMRFIKWHVSCYKSDKSDNSNKKEEKPTAEKKSKDFNAEELNKSL